MLVAGIGAEARLVIAGTCHRLECYGLDELSASYTRLRHAPYAVHALDAFPEGDLRDPLLFPGQQYDHPLKGLHLAPTEFADLGKGPHGPPF